MHQVLDVLLEDAHDAQRVPRRVLVVAVNDLDAAVVLLLQGLDDDGGEPEQQAPPVRVRPRSRAHFHLRARAEADDLAVGNRLGQRGGMAWAGGGGGMERAGGGGGMARAGGCERREGVRAACWGFLSAKWSWR
jgi:hypothetical protein